MLTFTSRQEPRRRGVFERLAAGIASIAFLTACASPSEPDTREAPEGVSVLHIGEPVYSGPSGAPLQQACSGWRLSPRQVERFFHLSSNYPENPYSSFYQVPCSISGSLRTEGRVWKFEINGGATATWRADEAVRYWGCSEEACDGLVLLPTDLMQPDAEPMQP